MEVEEYTLQQFGQQMTHVLSDRRPTTSQDKIRQFVRRCVRRQVEAAVYLPLRRTVFRIVYSFVAVKVSLVRSESKHGPIKPYKGMESLLMVPVCDALGSETAASDADAQASPSVRVPRCRRCGVGQQIACCCACLQVTSPFPRLLVTNLTVTTVLVWCAGIWWELFCLRIKAMLS